ncbi:MAG: hypothetical protein HY999_04580 [Nitrospinae bacterium]|nr:hypothetical protein [Nitrospinota bacterium]
MENKDIRNDPFSNLLEIILGRKIQVIIGFLIVFIITVIGVFLMPPVYEASTKIYINLPAIPTREDIPYLADLKSLGSFVSNQLEIIKSRLIFEKVVRELHLHEKKEGPSFSERFQTILFQVNQDPLEDAINDLYKHTLFDIKRGTNIMEVTVSSRSSKESADIANNLANTYIYYANNLLFNKAQNAYSFITAQLETARKELVKSQNLLNELKRQENVISLISLDDDNTIIRNKLNEYDNQYQEVQAEIQRLENQPSHEDIDNTDVIYQIQPNDSPKVKDLKTRLKELKEELDMVLQNYTDKHPTVKSLRSQIARLGKKLSSEMNLNININDGIQTITLNNLKGKRDNLSKEIQILEGKLRRLSKNEIELTKLTQDVNNKEREYLMLKEDLEKAKLLKANEMQEGSIKIIDPAFPPLYPQNKKKIVLLTVGFMVSLLFSIGMAFIAEYRDDSFKNREETEEYLNLPVFATIPPITKKMRKERPYRRG